MYTPQYMQGALRLECNQYIVHNDLDKIITSLEANKYNNQGTIPWQLALDHSKEIPGKGPCWHALDLFVIHALSVSPTLEAQIIAHLKTKAGRQSMDATVEACLVKNISYADKIIALGQDPQSLFFQGIHPQRINVLSTKPSTTFQTIMDMCRDANRQHITFQSKINY